MTETGQASAVVASKSPSTRGLRVVTGGAGFIGSNIAGALASRGDRVVVVDFFGSGDKWRNLAKHDVFDFVNPSDLAAWWANHGDQVTALIHMGGVSATTETDCDLIVESNFRLSNWLWAQCGAMRIPFIYASSGAVYGDGTAGFEDIDTSDALASLRPMNAYGWSKLAFDRRVLISTRNGETCPPKWAGLRFFNVYGPNEYHKGAMRSVIAINYSRVAAGEPIELFKSYRSDYGDGRQLRDFVWVGDCVDVVLWMLDNDFAPGVYNVGTGEARSWLDLSHSLFKACGAPPQIRFVDMPLSLRQKYQYFTQARIEKLRAAGYRKPMTSLEAGVETYVHGFLSREDWYA